VRDRRVKVPKLRAHHTQAMLRGGIARFIAQQRGQHIGGTCQIVTQLQAILPHQAQPRIVRCQVKTGTHLRRKLGGAQHAVQIPAWMRVCEPCLRHVVQRPRSRRDVS
jgi:hypothetical protein